VAALLLSLPKAQLVRERASIAAFKDIGGSIVGVAEQCALLPSA